MEKKLTKSDFSSKEFEIAKLRTFLSFEEARSYLDEEGINETSSQFEINNVIARIGDRIHNIKNNNLITISNLEN